MQPYFSYKDVGQSLRSSLINEERLFHELTHQNEHLPIDIENTWAGMSIEYLLRCLQRKDALLPYHNVSYRVISQIANVLMVFPIKQIEENMENPKSSIDFMKLFENLKKDFHQ